MKRVIIDTSSILYGFSYNRNIFETLKSAFPEYRQLVSRGIINELTRLSANRGAKGLRARVALLELKAKKINVDNISTYPDKWILNTAPKRKGTMVVTNDTVLARKLARSRVKVLKVSKSGLLKDFQ
ncbi:MAG: hypothetical protein KGI06_01830 [Candidatus Micrarchaeota archaeon]|nr:hypothetical protein [Candidatus Micrarchaeota archaeon]